MDKKDRIPFFYIMQSNEIVEASYKLTLQEQSIILYIASKIERKDKYSETIKVSFKEFADILDAQNASHEYMEKVTADLMGKVLIIEEKDSTIQVGWLSSVVYYHTENVVEFKFDPEIKPYLLQLKERLTTTKIPALN